MNLKRSIDDLAKRAFGEILDAEKEHYHKGGIVTHVDEQGEMVWDYGELADIVRTYKQELFDSVYDHAKRIMADERERMRYGQAD